MSVATAQPRAADQTRVRTWADRALAVAPLVTIFFWACAIYGYQAWAHRTPWLFSDEIEYAQLSRAIADTGHAALRGEPEGYKSLYAYLIAPVWWIDSTSTAYAVAKYLGVALMSASMFPVYALARMLVRPVPALFAAALTVAAPALVYSSFIITEPLAYPYAALCFFLMVKALATRRGAWILPAVVVVIGAEFVRHELRILVPAFALGAVWMLWTSDRAVARRTGWGALHWGAFLALLAGASFGASELVGAYSPHWHEAMHELFDRVVRYGIWAAGALTIGLGVLPVVAGLTTLARPAAPRSPAFRAFVGVFGSAVLVFCLYTAVKAAYLSTIFAILVEERNLIYLTPVVAVAFAVWLDSPRVRVTALALAGAAVGYLLVATPYQLSIHPYADAPGLAILAWANRHFRWDDNAVEQALLGALAFSLVLVLAASNLRRARAVVTPVLAACAVGVLAWNLTGEISGANASNSLARQFYVNLPHPLDWVDRATHGGKVFFIGQAIRDGNGVWSLEFWNRSIQHVGSLDATAPGPGPILTPLAIARDGRTVNDPGVPFVLADVGVDVSGQLVATKGNLRLYRVEHPLRLRYAISGVYTDGWTGEYALYSRFADPRPERGVLTVTVSRQGWQGQDVPTPVVVRVGTLVPPSLEDVENPCRKHPCARLQPSIGRLIAEEHWVAHSGATKRYEIPIRTPVQVDVSLSRTFVPADYGGYDTRHLGIQASFSFRPDR